MPHTTAWHSDITNGLWPHSVYIDTTVHANTQCRWYTASHPALQRHASCTPPCFPSSMARTHANALSTETAQNRMAQRHHRRNSMVCHRPRRLTPAGFPFPNGRRRHAKPHGAATSRTTRYNNVTPCLVDTANQPTPQSPATHRVYAIMFPFRQWQGLTHGTATSQT